MNQKRFLTAGEVFQLFGVDTEMLDQLVEAGDVQALPDLGSFRYRREDFVKLVQDGRLSPRTAGEMFQVDSQGDIPFLKLQQDDGVKFEEDVEFLELDEDALNEQAGQPRSKTPVGPATPLGDSDETASMQTSREVSVFDAPNKSSKEKTDFELAAKNQAESDSNVRLVGDDTIDFEDSTFAASGSDSDVRLSGPVSSSIGDGTGLKSESDSDVRFFKMTSESDGSDSDVTILPSAAIPPAPKSLSKGNAKQPDSDSDVQIAPSTIGQSAGDAAQTGHSSGANDSDIILTGSPSDLKTGSSKLRVGKRPDSDSDVRLAGQSLDQPGGSSSIHADSDSDVKLSDSSVRLEPTPAPVADFAATIHRESDESDGISLDMLTDLPDEVPVGTGNVPDNPETAAELAEQAAIESSNTEVELPIQAEFGNELRLHKVDEDAFAADDSDFDTEFTLASPTTDSEIAVVPDSGISFEAPKEDSGISLDPSAVDSGISLEPATSDNKLASAAQQPSSDIVLSRLQDDSNVRFGLDDDSGISLDAAGADSGIMLDQADSGIRFDSAGDSGISLADADSGISLEDDADDFGATFADQDLSSFDAKSKNVSQTETFESRDSGFDVSLAESDHTMEMVLEDDEEGSSADTIVQKDKGKKGSSGSKTLDLSEAFQLDEPLEVEDLDISEDLDAAVGSDFSDEFASIDEEVVEVSDDDFSAGDVSAVEDADDESLETPVAAPKRRAGPTEPPWGMAAVAPIIGASLAMAVTVLVLWGGVSTMWDGSEAGGPAALLISTLGGLF